MPNPSSAFARAAGLALTISWLATISETTNPAPKDATNLRYGKSVIPAIGARKTGGSRVISPSWMGMCAVLPILSADGFGLICFGAGDQKKRHLILGQFTQMHNI